MNTPKKPGTDLAALKARLAKKSKDGEEAAAPAAAEAPPVHEAPPPSPVDAAPAEQYYEPQPQAYEAAAPASTPAPAAQAPMAAPRAAPMPAPAPASYGASDDPFAGPSNASYDPGPDLGGEAVPGRSNVGVVLFSGVIFLGIGLGVGWLGHKIISGRERLESAKAKGDSMYKEVQEISNARKGVALKMDGELAAAVNADPVAGSQAIIALIGESFDKVPRLENLFGYQLAGIHPTGIKKTFELYEKSNRVKIELAALAGFLAENADALDGPGGPVSFGVKFTEDGAQMVALTGALCGEDLTDLAALTPCPDPSKAIAFKVQEGLGTEPKTLPRGTSLEQVVFLAPTGQIYNYAVGLEPAKNAAKVRDFMMKRIKETVDEMATAEATALKAMANYAENPAVDDASAQAEP